MPPQDMAAMAEGESLAAYRYELPDEAIAQTPAEPRDSARLLDTRTLTDRTVADLPDLLEAGDVVVVNNTRVRAARLHATKPTGGAVELLVLAETDEGWECLVRPARRIRPGMVLDIGGTRGVVRSEPHEGRVIVDFESDVDQLAEKAGEVPLPPYIRGPIPRDRYQTVYNARVGSAAAPTAGLHITERLLARLAARSIDVVTLDLEVGLGTFRPITAPRIEDHRMHTERYSIPEETARLVNGAGRVVAIGTTVVRALESAGRAGPVAAGSSSTELFIRPGFEFTCVDLLVTNFHVPGSSLVVMIAAFMGPAWRTAYEVARRRGYRFLSFGDAMLCERSA